MPRQRPRDDGYYFDVAPDTQKGVSPMIGHNLSVVEDSPAGPDARIATLNAPLDLRTATRDQLVNEVHRVRGIIAAGAKKVRELTSLREMLTIEKTVLTEKLACRETLLLEYERELRK